MTAFNISAERAIKLPKEMAVPEAVMLQNDALFFGGGNTGTEDEDPVTKTA